MARKKWTAREELTPELISLREKRKWQVALRRYIIDKNLSEYYAPYFALDIETMRRWIWVQLNGKADWKDFGSKWQFSHVVPVSYFNFQAEDDMKLCWHFTNIRVEWLETIGIECPQVNEISAQRYYHLLFESTQNPVCEAMIIKLQQIETSSLPDLNSETLFFEAEKEKIHILSGLNQSDYSRINSGESLTELLAEKEILRKFG